jgi:hypothetical protein
MVGLPARQAAVDIASCKNGFSVIKINGGVKFEL